MPKNRVKSPTLSSTMLAVDIGFELMSLVHLVFTFVLRVSTMSSRLKHSTPFMLRMIPADSCQAIMLQVLNASLLLFELAELQLAELFIKTSDLLVLLPQTI